MTQIHSDEELIAHLWKSLDDVKHGRTLDAKKIRENIQKHAKKSAVAA